MFESVALLLAVCVALAVLCALFGDEEHARRGNAVLRELLSVLRNENGHDEGKE